MGGEFLEKFVIIHPLSHLSLLLGLLAEAQSVVWVLLSLFSDTIPMWDHFRFARSKGPTALGFPSRQVQGLSRPWCKGVPGGPPG